VLGALIPHVSFVDFYFVSSANLAELVLKRHLRVVFLLVRDISFDLSDVGFAHGKNSVSTLPLEMLQAGVLFLDPFWGFVFRCLDYVHDREFAWNLTQDIWPPPCSSTPKQAPRGMTPTKDSLRSPRTT